MYIIKINYEVLHLGPLNLTVLYMEVFSIVQGEVPLYINNQGLTVTVYIHASITATSFLIPIKCFCINSDTIWLV